MPLPPVKVLGYVVTVCHEPIMGEILCSTRWGWGGQERWRWCRALRNGWRECFKYLTSAEREAVKGALAGETPEPIKAALEQADALIEQRYEDPHRGRLDEFRARMRTVLLAGLSASGWDMSPIALAARRVAALPGGGASHTLRLVSHRWTQQLPGGVTLHKAKVLVVDEDLIAEPGDVVYAAVKWGDGSSLAFGVYRRDEQGAHFTSLDRDWPGDRLRDFTVTGVVVRVLPNREEAIAFARERGIDWKPARQPKSASSE